MSNHKTLKIGTRGSPLAMVQTRTVIGLLAKAFPELETEIVVIKTSGDWTPEQGETRLSAVEGGKGLFAKEIERALLDGEIDAAVHSMKDMDSILPEGLVIEHMLPREDVRDALLFSEEVRNSEGYNPDMGIKVMPEGCVVGTASVRRAAILKSKRQDIECEPIRGNVGTRIEKVRKGQVGCTCLAMAGLNRLNLSDEADLVLSAEQMLPAAGQGAVGIECREGDAEILSIIGQINDEKTVLCVSAEREVLRVIDGSCHTPIGAYAVLEGQEMWLRVELYALDGSQSFKDEIRAEISTVEDAKRIGREIGERLKTEVPREVFAA